MTRIIDKDKKKLQKYFKRIFKGIIIRLILRFIVAITSAIMNWWLLYFFELAMIYIQLKETQKLQPIIEEYHLIFTYKIKTTEQHLQETKELRKWRG